MPWSIAEVARMSGTTPRTLRHYHDIGLLAPAQIGGNGYRYYEREQLERLQQILLLREMGLGLRQIAEVLEGQQDPLASLRSHLDWLRNETDRLARLQRTVERTILDLEGGISMTDQDLFHGFSQQQYEVEVVSRFGDAAREHIDTAKGRTRDWQRDDFLEAQRGFADILHRLAAVRAAGHAPETEEAISIIADHYSWVTQFWTPDSVAYSGLADLYAEDERFRQQIEEVQVGLTEFLRSAMHGYAKRQLDVSD